MLRTSSCDFKSPLLCLAGMLQFGGKGHGKIHRRPIRLQTDADGPCRIAGKILSFIMRAATAIGYPGTCMINIQLSAVIRCRSLPFIGKPEAEAAQGQVGFIEFPQHAFLDQTFRFFIFPGRLS